jgi:hypothetical protein
MIYTVQQGMTGEMGTTGEQGITGIHTVHLAGYLFFDQASQDQMQIFYNYLSEIFEKEEEYKQRTMYFLDISYQMDFDKPVEMDDLFRYFLTYFYLIRPKVNNHLWLRMEKTIRRINIQNNSGSVYLSPFFESNDSVIFLGLDDFKNGVYVTQAGKLIKLTPYYMSRVETYPVHKIEDRLFEIKKCKKPLYTSVSAEMFYDHIVNGMLSDEMIYCQDGMVNVSKALLTQTSNYFLHLFTNTKFLKQEKFTLEFPKEMLLDYLRFKCQLKIKNTESIVELIEFASFIQDQSFIQGINEHIYENAEHFSDKSLIELSKILQNFGY